MKKRVEFIDILRGIGILYMVFGHVKLYLSYDHYIHAFHMPLFLFVTGLFFKRNNNTTFLLYLKKITKQLLLPYTIWGLLFFLFTSITRNGLNENWVSILLQVLTVNNNGFPIAAALWFLTCLYFAQIIIYFLDKVIKKDLIFVAGCMIIMIFGMYYKRITGIELWWSLDVSFVSVGIICLGYIVNKLNVIEMLTNKNFLYTIILFIINAIFIMKTGYVNLRTGTYPNVLLFIFNFMLSMIVYINISKIILETKCLKKISSMISYIGENSIVSLCLNQFIIYLWQKVLNHLRVYGFLINNFKYSDITYSIFIFLLSMITLYFMTKLVMKSKLKYLFGK